MHSQDQLNTKKSLVAVATETNDVHPTISVDNLEKETMGNCWLEALRPEMSKPYFHKVRPYHLGPGFTIAQ